MSTSVVDQQPVNLIDILRGLFRRKLLLLSMPLIGIGLAQAYVMHTKPLYNAEAMVIIQDSATPYDRPSAVNDASGLFGATASDKLVASQVYIMKSADIRARIVDKLGLDKRPEYNSKLGTRGTLGNLMIKWGFKDDPNKFSDKNLANKSLDESLSIFALADTYMIGIKSTSTDPEMAASTANEMADTYVASTQEITGSSNERARAWLQQQINDLRGKVADAESAIEQYRAEAGLLRGTTATLNTQQLTELNAQITVAETAHNEAQTRADQIKALLAARGSVDASADVLSSTLVQNLREQQVAAARALSQLSGTYLPNHPKMISAQRELDTINGQVRAEALRVVDSLQGQANVAERRAGNLRAQLEKLKTTQAQANFSDVKLQELTREANAQRSLLQAMLSRLADANSRQDVNMRPNLARVVQRAVTPSVPFLPKPGPTLTLGGVAGLLMGLGLAFMMEVMAQSGAPLRRFSPARAKSGPKLKTEQIEPVTVQEPIIEPQAQEVRAQEAKTQPTMPVAVPPRPARIEPQSFPDDSKRINTLRAASDRMANAKVESVADLAPISVASPASVSSKQVSTPAFSILGVMPATSDLHMASALSEVALDTENGVLSEGHRNLIEALKKFQSEDGVSSCSFTAVGASASTAALATLLAARGLMQHGGKIILVDLASGQDNLQNLLQIDAAPGIAELIQGKADFSKVVTRDPASGVHFVRAGQLNDTKVQATIVAKLPKLLKTLQGIYTHVLLNLGEASNLTVPLMASAGTCVLLAPQSKLSKAANAAKALQQTNGTKTLLIKLEPEAAPAAISA